MSYNEPRRPRPERRPPTGQQPITVRRRDNVEMPPILTDEDERILDEIWADIAREEATQR